MKITLFRAFPDSYRQSMTLYADQLAENIAPELASGEILKNFLPKILGTKPAAIRYLSQYILYPLSASRAAGDVNHIIDHSYSHLVHSLPAKQTAVTFHDAIWLETPAKGGREYIRSYNLSGLSKAGAIICDSEASRHALLRRITYPEKKTFLIYPGLDPLFLKPYPQDPFEALNLKKDLYMLHVGHTGDYKNIPALFKVLSHLRKRGLDVKLLKTGTPFTPAQKNLISNLNLSDAVIHLGLVEREKLPLVYRAAKCLLFPSFNEGFGFPILEAMACGTPVISSNRGSLPELSAYPDLLSDPEDCTRMSAIAAEFFDNQTKREFLIEEGYKKIRDFSWRRTAHLVYNVYKMLANGGRE